MYNGKYEHILIFFLYIINNRTVYKRNLFVHGWLKYLLIN